MKTADADGGLLDRIGLVVADIVHCSPNEITVTARCLTSLAIGTMVSDKARTTSLYIAVIERYPGVYVDVLEPSHAAQIVLRGERTGVIQPGAELVIYDAQHAETQTRKS